MAAQQSSAAMLDAARTAAGLAQSITLVEHEIDSTDMIFAQAAAQSAEAVENSRQLSDEVQSIESILGFIRDIAGQTNLLALNATIEARSEEHTSELQSLMRNSYAVFCLKKKKIIENA